MIDIEGIKRGLELMRATGSDEGQYLLIRMRDLEELVEAWERDQMLQEWMRDIIEAIGEVDYNEKEPGGEGSESTESIKRDEPSEHSNRSGDRKMGDFQDKSQETNPEEHSGPEDILPVS